MLLLEPLLLTQVESTVALFLLLLLAESGQVAKEVIYIAYHRSIYVHAGLIILLRHIAVVSFEYVHSWIKGRTHSKEPLLIGLIFLKVEV